MKSAYLSHKGNVRELNEDSVYAGELADKAFLALVADGMGGYNAGEIASRMAVDEVRQCLPSLDGKGLAEGFRQANQKIFDLAVSKPEYRNMGTTLAGCIIKENMLYAANVGDSRIYLICGKKIRQITVDHSYVQELVDMGHITKDEAAGHPNKNIITRAIGTDRSVEVDTFAYKVKGGDMVILCSDGLSNYLDETELLAVAQKYKKPETCARHMLDAALERGGCDNISVIVLKL